MILMGVSTRHRWCFNETSVPFPHDMILLVFRYHFYRCFHVMLVVLYIYIYVCFHMTSVAFSGNVADGLVLLSH